jgi:hypothetical protein
MSVSSIKPGQSASVGVPNVSPDFAARPLNNTTYRATEIEQAPEPINHLRTAIKRKNWPDFQAACDQIDHYQRGVSGRDSDWRSRNMNVAWRDLSSLRTRFGFGQKVYRTLLNEVAAVKPRTARDKEMMIAMVGNLKIRGASTGVSDSTGQNPVTTARNNGNDFLVDCLQ